MQRGDMNTLRLHTDKYRSNLRPLNMLISTVIDNEHTYLRKFSQ